MQPPYSPSLKVAPQVTCLAARFPSQFSHQRKERNLQETSWLRWLLCFGLIAAMFCGASALQAQTTPTLAVGLSPVSPEYTDTTTVTATLTGTGAVQPTGTITYTVEGGNSGTATITQNATNSVAYFPIPPQAPGPHTLIVNYSGDSNYAAIVADFQPFTVADRVLELNGSNYVFTPTLYVAGGEGYSQFGLNGIAVDKNLNLFLAYGTTAAESGGEPVIPKIAEITENGLQYVNVPVTGLGTDARLAVDTPGNLYIADPTNARVVEYSTAGVQTNVAVTGLSKPTCLTYDPGTNSVFILDSGLGGVVQFNLSSKIQTTIFSGVTGLQPAVAADGVGGLYYAVGANLMFRSPNGITSPIYGEFNGGGFPNPYNTIVGLAFDPVRAYLWVSSASNSLSGTAMIRLDGLHHASFVGFTDADTGQVSIDPYGTAYTPLTVYTDDPYAANAGAIINNVIINAEAELQLPYGHAGGEGDSNPNPTTPGVYNSIARVGISIPSGQSVGFGAISFPAAVSFDDGSQASIPVYGTGYGQWMITDPGAVYPLSTPFGQPTGIAYAAPYLLSNETVYVSDKANNTVTSIVYLPTTSISTVGNPTVLGFKGLVSPSQLAADGNGDVWVLDQGAASGGARVVRLDYAGNQTVPYTAATGDQLGLVKDVSAFAVDGPQDLYLGGTQGGSGVIVKIDSLGLETQVASGIGVPAAITVDGAYNVYTVDASGNLLKFDHIGNKTTLATGLPAPTQISLDAAGSVYLSSASGTGVIIVAPDGTQRTVTMAGLTNPTLAVADYIGTIHVTDGVTKMLYADYRYQVNLNFGTVAVNSTASQTYVVSDVGDLQFLALIPYINQTNSMPFSLSPGATNPCEFADVNPQPPLQPGQSCNVLFQYAPKKAGMDTAMASLTSPSAITSPSVMANWNLSGTASGTTGAPVPTLTPPSLDFGSLMVGTTSPSQIATLSNSGTTTLTVSSIAIAGANASSFTETNTCGTSVAASASCTITVACKPSAAGALTASLTASYPSPLTAQTVALTCTGTSTVTPPAPAPQAALTPVTQDFGSVTVGSSSAAKTFTLTNAGTATLPITSVAITGANAGSFIVGTNGCGSTLAAGASCTVNISFSPTAAGSDVASLTVIDSVGTQTSALTGTGVAVVVVVPDFAIAATPPAQTVAAGASASYTVNITPASGFDSAVALTATGLPPGATVTFTPASVTPGSAAVSSAMVIHTATQAALLKSLPAWQYAGTTLAAVFFLLPFRRLRKWRGMLCALLFSTTLVVLGGCGGGFGLGTTAPTATTYTVTVTGTSGSLTHSTTVQITVQATAQTAGE